MHIKKPSVSAITGFRYWRICCWSLRQCRKKADQKLREMEKRALLAERQRDDALEKAKEFRLKFYETATQLEEEQGKNLKLHAQINRDYENSSIPSSKAIRRKKNCKQQGKNKDGNPGGQPGHKGQAEKAGAYTSR